VSKIPHEKTFHFHPFVRFACARGGGGNSCKTLRRLLRLLSAMDAMIQVNDLTKRYAGVTALRNVSFEVRKGEIVGFLGPNGAGKTTTMRILAGFIPATAGTARVAGFDVFHQSLEVRRRVGYMPENNPLYGEMRVNEYLKFRAKLKGVPRAKRKERLDYVIEVCGLKEMSRKVIATLSKGYRQRVGLADALVHEPDLLILDEPTIGLDPYQIRHVRELIKSLGERHTILLSTHILPEVEMTCQRVIIIHRGKIIASDTPHNLRQSMRAVAIRVEIAGDGAEQIENELKTVEGVEMLVCETGNDNFVRVTVQPKEGADPREAIFARVAAKNWRLRELSRTHGTLEDIFVQITREQDEEDEERRLVRRPRAQ
jgi:ABC-2 type transport system ATP-binding protein